MALYTHLFDQHKDTTLQGLHEIAGVLMLEVGENVAVQLLARLVTTHLRDCTRHSLDAVIESLHLLYPVVRETDPELARHLIAAGLPPFFALSWIITWFAHHVPPKDAARLFDLFIASHPLMPMYLFVVGMIEVCPCHCSSWQCMTSMCP